MLQTVPAAAAIAANEVDTSANMKNDVIGILQQFFAGVPHALTIYKKYSNAYVKPQTLAEENAETEASSLCINIIRTAIESRSDEILLSATTQILTYLNENSVLSNSHDQYKLVYWFGLTLSQKLTDPRAQKVAMLLTIGILDELCNTDCNCSVPEVFSCKMFSSIANGRSVDDFGKHGMYFAFKIISKSGK